MVANQPRTSSRPSSSKSKSSSYASPFSKPSTSTAQRASTSLMQTSAKKTLKSKSKSGNNKFRDLQKRELLDDQTNQLLASAGIANKVEAERRKVDPFSYGATSKADQRRTRREVDEAALALDLLMKS